MNRNDGMAAIGMSLVAIASLFVLGWVMVANAQNTPVAVGNSAGYPPYATPVVAAGTDTVNQLTVSLPSVAGKTTYICGFSVTAAGNGTYPFVFTSNLVGTKTFNDFGLVAGGPNMPYSHNFSPCIPALSPNTSIPIVVAANATATAVSINAWGYQY